jgi:hypothetical protein
MEDKAPSAGQSALYYALLIAVAAIVVHLVMYLLDQNGETAGMIIGTLVFIGLIIYVQLDFRNKKLGGFISYGKAVTIGFLSVLFASVIVAVYMFIYHSQINPGEAQQNLIEAKQQIYDYGLSPDQESSQIKMQEYIHTPLVYALSTILSYAIMGIIVALITSIFVKKEEKVSLQ